MSEELVLTADDPFDGMLIKMKKMHDIKGHDYGDEDEYANIRASEELGISPWIGVALRLNDKMQRLKKFARVGELKVKDESVLDTFIDIAVYAIIGHIMFEQGQGGRVEVVPTEFMYTGYTGAPKEDY